MTTLSVTIPNELAEFVENYVKDGNAENKSHFVRNVLQNFRDEYAILRIRESQNQVKKYGTLKGDLRTLVGKMK